MTLCHARADLPESQTPKERKAAAFRTKNEAAAPAGVSPLRLSFQEALREINALWPAAVTARADRRPPGPGGSAGWRTRW